MAIPIFLIVTGVVLFVGMFVGLLLSFREIEAERSQSKRPTQVERPPAFYGWSDHDVEIAEQLMLRQIEHHLRREAILAGQFIQNPSPKTLRAGEHSRLGMH